MQSFNDQANPPPLLIGSTAIHRGDSREILKELPSESVNCCVTSPPYFGLRDYQNELQIGLEHNPQDFVRELVSVFREVRRVLRDDGTLWLNLGDSYAGSWGARGRGQGTNAPRPDFEQKHGTDAPARNGFPSLAIKPKDLIGIPWRVALALQADGWYLRQDIIWHKPNPMPESVRDRCTKEHEYIFLLSKSERYYFDSDAIAEPIAASSIARLSQNIDEQRGSYRVPGKTNGPMKAVAGRSGNKERKPGSARGCPTGNGSNVCGSVPWEGTMRNKRSVWTVTTKPFKGTHFATFPPDLIEPCILAGCPEDGVVLDPFFGAGTTGVVATQNNRRAVGIELNPEYIDLAAARLRGEKIDPKSPPLLESHLAPTVPQSHSKQMSLL